MRPDPSLRSRAVLDDIDGKQAAVILREQGLRAQARLDGRDRDADPVGGRIQGWTGARLT